MVEEIIRHQPDLVCLQEVDHFPFISSALASSGYSGRWEVLDNCGLKSSNLPIQVLSEARLCLLLCPG